MSRTVSHAQQLHTRPLALSDIDSAESSMVSSKAMPDSICIYERSTPEFMSDNMYVKVHQIQAYVFHVNHIRHVFNALCAFYI